MMRKRKSARRRAPPRGAAHRSTAKKPQPPPRTDPAYASLDSLALIYDTAPVGLAVLSPDCRYVRINQRLTEICGIPVADHIGRSVRETVPQVAGQVEKIVAAVIRTGKPVTGVEVHGQRADRRNVDHVWITHWHPLKGPRGRIVGVNVVAEDVTERKRAEEELAKNERALRQLNETLEQRVEAETRERLQIWNVSQDLLAVADLAGKILSVNPAWTATLGWPQSDLLGRTAEWLQHPDDREKAEAELRHLAAGGRTLRFEGRLRHQDGAYRWLSWTAVADRDRVYAMARDVTELKQAEQSLRGMRRELALDGRRTMVAAMTASIAHEIKQPLGAIVANADAGLRWLSRSSPVVDEALETFRDIVADGHRASDVIQSIRDMFDGREQPGEPIDANALIRDTVAILRGELDAAGISTHLDLAPELPRVAAHRGQVQQVILNLLTNAADAMRSVMDRKRVLSVTSGPVEPDGIAVSVQDSGDRNRGERRRAHLRCLLHHEVSRHGHGPVDLQVDRRGAWRASLGRLAGAARRDLPLRPAGRPSARALSRGASMSLANNERPMGKDGPRPSRSCSSSTTTNRCARGSPTCSGRSACAPRPSRRRRSSSPIKLPRRPCCLDARRAAAGPERTRFPGRSSPSAKIDIPIIFITGHGDIPMTVRAMKAGAVEFLTKPFRDQDLLDAVQLALERDRATARERADVLATLQAKFETLTPREQEVMAWVTGGLMNKQIAAEIGVTEITVKVHRGNVTRKMGAKSLAELVRMADLLGVRRQTS